MVVIGTIQGFIRCSFKTKCATNGCLGKKKELEQLLRNVFFTSRIPSRNVLLDQVLEYQDLVLDSNWISMSETVCSLLSSILVGS